MLISMIMLLITALSDPGIIPRSDKPMDDESRTNNVNDSQAFFNLIS